MDHKWTVGRCLLSISSFIPMWISVWTVSEKPSVSIWVSLKSYFRKLTSARQQIYMTLFSTWLKSLISISLLYKVLVNLTQMERLDPNPSLLKLNHITPTRWLCIKFHENQESEQQHVCPFTPCTATPAPISRSWDSASSQEPVILVIRQIRLNGTSFLNQYLLPKYYLKFFLLTYASQSTWHCILSLLEHSWMSQVSGWSLFQVTCLWVPSQPPVGIDPRGGFLISAHPDLTSRKKCN